MQKKDVKLSKEEEAHLLRYEANPTSAVPLEKPTSLTQLPTGPSVPDLLKLNLKEFFVKSDKFEKVAAVIDTGIGTRKQIPAELEGKILIWYNYKGEDNLANPKADLYDSYGHGTHMAGLIAADAKSGTPVGGMAPMCKLISIKITDGDDCITPLYRITKALELVIDHNNNTELPRIDVVNISFNVYDNCDSSADVQEYDLYKALQTLKDMHVPVVVSGGNFYPFHKGDGLGYPAYCEQVIAAGACNMNSDGGMQILGITQRLPMPHSFSSKLPFFILTHGVNTYSTGINGYSYLSCSSQAAAVVTGLVLLYLVKETGTVPTVTEIKKKLFHNSRRLYLDHNDREEIVPTPVSRQFAMAHDISIIS